MVTKSRTRQIGTGTGTRHCEFGMDQRCEVCGQPACIEISTRNGKREIAMTKIKQNTVADKDRQRTEYVKSKRDESRSNFEIDFYFHAFMLLSFKFQQHHDSRD